MLEVKPCWVLFHFSLKTNKVTVKVFSWQALPDFHTGCTHCSATGRISRVETQGLDLACLDGFCFGMPPRSMSAVQ